MPLMLQQIDNRNCRLCGSEDPITLHTVRHQGEFPHLCTACVLAQHPASFCPICFHVYDDDNKKQPCAHSRVMCLRCPAVVHLTCLPAAAAVGYLCPRCSDPSFSFFRFKQPARTINGRRMVVFTRDLTKQLVCAAEIAAASMHKAAAIARANAEKKAREALAARRRAKEAIERMTYLMSGNASDLDDESSD
ncbi:hypothetical protein BUALT_Bualt02G0174800 [Buddleja alternifolia]|uniref:RING-type domain-containing protein n=1 Tax=Buddleja alternifolia TaxID=168488 RepID=A0AAV6Y289_9LAMI|nr:hypothetical protein BUALT_Bualt02G0174800 [Buddleja alternifolia]